MKPGRHWTWKNISLQATSSLSSPFLLMLTVSRSGQWVNAFKTTPQKRWLTSSRPFKARTITGCPSLFFLFFFTLLDEGRAGVAQWDWWKSVWIFWKDKNSNPAKDGASYEENSSLAAVAQNAEKQGVTTRLKNGALLRWTDDCSPPWLSWGRAER